VRRCWSGFGFGPVNILTRGRRQGSAGGEALDEGGDRQVFQPSGVRSASTVSDIQLVGGAVPQLPSITGRKPRASEIHRTVPGKIRSLARQAGSSSGGKTASGIQELGAHASTGPIGAARGHPVVQLADRVEMRPCGVAGSNRRESFAGVRREGRRHRSVTAGMQGWFVQSVLTGLIPPEGYHLSQRRTLEGTLERLPAPRAPRAVSVPRGTPPSPADSPRPPPTVPPSRSTRSPARTPGASVSAPRSRSARPAVPWSPRG
jgi:hypothetical protein